ncbi:unnamed protein product [Leptosia nina]|uniref:Uncharacterized protein n=1 Tax=Leptosia nina TaxID=320188 RepID=A0AAV1K259_9NEOP
MQLCTAPQYCGTNSERLSIVHLLQFYTEVEILNGIRFKSAFSAEIEYLVHLYGELIFFNALNVSLYTCCGKKRGSESIGSNPENYKFRAFFGDYNTGDNKNEN